ncbi:hypothetical protein [Streptomyces sp. NPDC059455]|uniref:hypothetical protein n=1 Tax=Streptomyces sp. NPDC059455 TaxID=3346837 RepID=UPI003678F491
MSVLLIGCWDGDTLTVEQSHTINDGDQEAIDALLAEVEFDWWACEYLVDRHSEAIQMAYDDQIAPGEHLVDNVEGYEPTP